MALRSVMDIPNIPVKNISLDTGSLGSNQLVPAVPGKQINVLSLALISKAANDIKFLSGATQIGATMPLGANGGFVLPYNSYGWFNTSEGEALNINLSVAAVIGVMLTYIEE